MTNLKSDAEIVMEWINIFSADVNNSHHKIYGCKSCIAGSNKVIQIAKELLTACEWHTQESTGYYGCRCTGDSDDVNQALSTCRKIVEGK